MLVALAAAVGLAGTPALRAQPAQAPGKGWGRLVASGTLTAVDPSSGNATLTIVGAGRLETFEGGAVWRKSTLNGAHPIRFLPVTLFLDTDARPVAPATLRSGEPASVWAAVRPDATIFALTLQVTSPRPRVATAAPRADDAAGTTGVVIQRTGQTLTLLTPLGARRNVVITAATAVRKGGQPAKEADLVPYAVVRIAGPVNSDGSLAATRIDIDFAAASAQVSGPVEEQVSGLGGLVVGGTMVCASADTYVVYRNAHGTLAQITLTQPVAVYGMPMLAGSTPVGLEARVLVVR